MQRIWVVSVFALMTSLPAFAAQFSCSMNGENERQEEVNLVVSGRMTLLGKVKDVRYRYLITGAESSTEKSGEMVCDSESDRVTCSPSPQDDLIESLVVTATWVAPKFRGTDKTGLMTCFRT